MTGEAPDPPLTKENPVEPYLSIISINQHTNQHLSSSISINKHQSASTNINQNINQYQLASIRINKHQSASASETIYTDINAPNSWGTWGGYREILRSVRMLCEKVVRGRLQELLSKLKICVTIQMPDSKTSALLLDEKTTVNNGRWLTWPGAGRATLEHKAGLRDVY